MKVAISSSGKDLDSQIDPRFGRCAYFIICETDNMKFEAFENESSLLGGGAGIQSAQFVASKGAEAVITGNCGPNAVKTLEAAGVKLFVGQSGTIKGGIERLKDNELKAAREANVPDHFGIQGGDTPSRQDFGSTGTDQYSNFGMGMGGGRGMGMCGGKGMRRGMGMGGDRGMGGGMGMGGGRGMGGDRGMGRGSGMAGVNEFEEASQTNLPKDQELNLLKKQSEELLRQVGDIQARIKKLETND